MVILLKVHVYSVVAFAEVLIFTPSERNHLENSGFVSFQLLR